MCVNQIWCANGLSHTLSKDVKINLELGVNFAHVGIFLCVTMKAAKLSRIGKIVMKLNWISISIEAWSLRENSSHKTALQKKFAEYSNFATVFSISGGTQQLMDKFCPVHEKSLQSILSLATRDIARLIVKPSLLRPFMSSNCDLHYFYAVMKNP